MVLASQDAGLSAVRDGVRAAEIDRACREVVEAAGMGELFVHGTGHGVGLDIHESPSLAGPSDDILCSGQVVTVEPGVYVPGLGGARTEDTVLVTEGRLRNPDPDAKTDPPCLMGTGKQGPRGATKWLLYRQTI